jgi:hypothetical protein
MKQPKTFDEWTKLSTSELREATKDLDKPFAARKFEPLTAAQRREWERVRRRRPGRPKIGRGSKVVSIGVERELLRRADALAKKEGVSRSLLFARGIEMLLASAG